jgi:CheY-like chemotaxis protein
MPTASHGLIFVVEDERIQRHAYVDALKAHGFVVASASSGEEAARLLSHYTPRLVILDVNLPGIGGPEVCRRIRKQMGTGVTVIFVTSNDTANVLLECVEAGGDDFLIKGSSVTRVLERVSYWLNSPARSLRSNQRESIVKNVRTAITLDPSPRPAAAPPAKGWRSLDPKADPNLASLIEFIAAARAYAKSNFGRTVKQKLYLLGYIAGVVNYVANSNMVLKIRFLEYLKATLHRSGVLELEDVDDLVNNWHEFYGQPTFEAAGLCGEMDYQSWAASQQPPRGLATAAETADFR